MSLPWLFLWLFPPPIGDVDVSLADLHALPCHAVAAFCEDRAQELCAWVGQQACAAPDGSPVRAYFEAYYAEVSWRRDAWHLLATATDEGQTDACRLNYLRQLRDSIGREAFYGGRLPPVAPLARIPRLP